MLRTKVLSKEEFIHQQSIANYHDALTRVRVARINLQFVDLDMMDVVYDELRNAEEALNLAIKRVKLTDPTKKLITQ